MREGITQGLKYKRQDHQDYLEARYLTAQVFVPSVPAYVKNQM